MKSISQNAGVTVINTGVWIGYAYFFRLKGYRGVVLNESGGSLTATATYGTALILNDGGAVTNQVGASITANTGIYISGGLGLVTNAGAIASYLAKSNGSVGVNLKDGGRVNNQATGTIEITGPVGAVGVEISGARGKIDNLGAIGASGEQSVGVWLDAGGTIANSGRISGARYGIYFQGGAGRIINTGTITGLGDAIKFAGSGANTLTLKTGSVVNGDVIGSTAKGATNALYLFGFGSANSPFRNFETLDVEATGQWSLGGAQAFDATTVETGVLGVAGLMTTRINEGASSSVAIVGDATLELNGASTLGGSTQGAGTLALIAGATTVANGARLTVANWSVTSATAILDAALTYAGVFDAGPGAVVADLGGSLTLKGYATFAGATTSGANALIDDADTSMTGLTIGGAGFVNEGLLTQSATSVILGDAHDRAAMLINNAGAVWNFAYDSGIALGGSSLSSISNYGLIEKTGGAGVSAIAPAIDNAGELLVNCGVLEVKGAVTGTGVDSIVGEATLEFDACVASTQTISFSGSEGALVLGAKPMFAGVFSGFDTVGSNDSVELLGSWTLDSYSQSSAARGTLMLSDATQTIKLTFEGAYSESDFYARVGTGHTFITYQTITRG
jgi:hypothetical protein